MCTLKSPLVLMKDGNIYYYYPVHHKYTTTSRGNLALLLVGVVISAGFSGWALRNREFLLMAWIIFNPYPGGYINTQGITVQLGVISDYQATNKRQGGLCVKSPRLQRTLIGHLLAP